MGIIEFPFSPQRNTEAAPASAIPPSPSSQPPRLGGQSEAAPRAFSAKDMEEAEEIVAWLVIQYGVPEGGGRYHSGYLTAMADAMRWLASRGRAEMVKDGPGRNVVIRIPWAEDLC